MEQEKINRYFDLLPPFPAKVDPLLLHTIPILWPYIVRKGLRLFIVFRKSVLVMERSQVYFCAIFSNEVFELEA